MKYPKGIKAVFDTEDKYYNDRSHRYTVVFDKFRVVWKERHYEAVASSINPKHPQGFYQHVTVFLKRIAGRKISWRALPKDVRDMVNKERKYYV